MAIQTINNNRKNNFGPSAQPQAQDWQVMAAHDASVDAINRERVAALGKGYVTEIASIASIGIMAMLLVVFVAMANAQNAMEDKGRQLLNQTLDAHGGLEKWQSYQTFKYAIPDFPLGAKAPLSFTHTADLQNRRHLMEGANFRLGFDGQTAWAVNGDNAGIPARFVTVGNSYFAMMPFVFADQGAKVSYAGEATYKGRAYETLNVSYGAGQGDSADDVYTLYIDKQTKQLGHITFTVTYKAMRGDKAASEVKKRKIMTFHKWQTANGLVVPAKVSLNAWNNGDVKGEGSAYHIKSVSFEQAAKGDALFNRPDHGVIDNTHQ